MASKRSQPRSRKRGARRRSGAGGGHESAPRREHESAPRREPAPARSAGAYRTAGERPESPFGGLPVSEISIFLGGICALVGLFDGGGAALLVGVAVCALGVLEFTAREHFSGYRSHTLLLAAFPAAVVEFVVSTSTGGSSERRLIILIPAGAVFGVCFWLLHRRFLVARQARITRAALTHR